MTKLKIKQFGQFKVWQNSQLIDAKAWGRQKTKHLLKVLLTNPGGLFSQDQLMEALFREYPADKARVNLRGRISELRSVLEPSLEQKKDSTFILTVGHSYCFNKASDVWIDTDVFERLLHEGQNQLSQEKIPQALETFQQAIHLYDDVYLAEDLYEEWSLPHRDHFQKTLLHALSKAAHCQSLLGNLTASLKFCHQAIAVAPYDERIFQQFMLYHYLNGQKQLAIECYHQCVHQLQVLDQTPNTDTEALAQQIQHDQVEPIRRFIPNNLPVNLSEFVGRGEALSDIGQLIESQHLITLTGMGGCGKTRLAIEFAQQCLNKAQFNDGIWLVELGNLNDEAIIPQQLSQTMGLRIKVNQHPIEDVIELIKSKNLLLVIDNAEHLIESCAHLCEAVVQKCPDVYMVVTSREPFNIPSEYVYPVLPLSVPESELEISFSALEQYEAVQLFVRRAQRSQSSFKLSKENAQIVGKICRYLDGIPLALELASARLRVLSEHQIAERLTDQFELLSSGTRTADERQKTLLNLMDWSYELLSWPQQALLRRLAIFEGGFHLDAVEAICSGDGVSKNKVFKFLSELVDKSMVMALDESLSERRFKLLETVKQYGRLKLNKDQESANIDRQYLDYYLKFAELAAPELRGSDQSTWLVKLQHELDNFRKCLELALRASVNEKIMLRFCNALARFWNLHGHWSEGRYWLEKAIQEATEDSLEKAIAMNYLGIVLQNQAVFDKAKIIIEQSIAIKKEFEDTQEIAISLTNLGNLYVRSGNPEQAIDIYHQAFDQFSHQGDLQREVEVLQNIGAVHFLQFQYDLALDSFLKAQAHFQTLSDTENFAKSLNNIGICYKELGNYSKAILKHMEALDIFQSLNDPNNLALTYSQLAIAHANLVLKTHLYLIFGPLSTVELLSEPIDYLTNAIETHQQLNNSKELTKDHFNLACLFHAAGESEKNITHLNNVLKLEQQLGDARLRARTLSALARAYLQLDQSNTASIYSNEAVELMESDDLTGLEDVHFTHYRSLQLDKQNISLSLKHLEKAHELILKNLHQATTKAHRQHIHQLNQPILLAWKKHMP